MGDKNNHVHKSGAGNHLPRTEGVSAGPFEVLGNILGHAASVPQPAARDTKEHFEITGKGEIGTTVTTTTTVNSDHENWLGMKDHDQQTTTVTTAKSPQLSGTVDYSKDSDTHTTSQNVPQPRHGSHFTGNRPVQHTGLHSPAAEDAILVKSHPANANADVDIGANARVDAAALSKSVADLRVALGKYGIFKTEMHLKVKGVDDVTLMTAVQKDYTGQQESTLTLDYTDHLGRAFDQGIAQMDITPANLQKATAAFKKATAELNTTYAQGGAVSQDDVSQLVRTTLQRELAAMR